MAPVAALLLCLPLVYGIFLFPPCSETDCIFNAAAIGGSQGLEEDVFSFYMNSVCFLCGSMFKLG